MSLNLQSVHIHTCRKPTQYKDGCLREREDDTVFCKIQCPKIPVENTMCILREDCDNVTPAERCAARKTINLVLQDCCKYETALKWKQFYTLYTSNSRLEWEKLIIDALSDKPRIIYKRSPQNLFNNSFNVMLGNGWNAHTDLQAIATADNVAFYVNKYVFKPEIALSDELKIQLNQTGTLKSVANIASMSAQIFMKYREVPIPAAIWQAANFPFHFGKENKVISIPIPSRNEIFIALANETRRKDKLGENNKSVVYQKLTNINVLNYMHRPRYLENMCYASFITTYNSKSKRNISLCQQIRCLNTNTITKRKRKLCFRYYRARNTDCSAFGDMFLYLPWRTVLSFFPTKFIISQFPDSTHYCFEEQLENQTIFDEIQTNKKILKPFFHLLEHAFGNRKISKNDRSWINAEIDAEPKENYSTQIINRLLPLQNGEDYDNYYEESDDDNDVIESSFCNDEHLFYEINNALNNKNTPLKPISAQYKINYTELAKQIEWEILKTPQIGNSITRDLLISMVTPLNKQQQRIVSYYSDWASQETPGKSYQQFVFLTGDAGTGKTTAANAIIKVVEYLLPMTAGAYVTTQTVGRTRAKTVMKCAFTGSAALNLNGNTIHSIFKFPPTINFSDDFTPLKDGNVKNDFIMLFQHVRLLIIDEISLINANMLYWIHCRCQEAKQQVHIPFGGISILLIGDFYQLPTN